MLSEHSLMGTRLYRPVLQETGTYNNPINISNYPDEEEGPLEG